MKNQFVSFISSHNTHPINLEWSAKVPAAGLGCVLLVLHHTSYIPIPSAKHFQTMDCDTLRASFLALSGDDVKMFLTALPMPPKRDLLRLCGTSDQVVCGMWCMLCDQVINLKVNWCDDNESQALRVMISERDTHQSIRATHLKLA